MSSNGGGELFSKCPILVMRLSEALNHVDTVIHYSAAADALRSKFGLPHVTEFAHQLTPR
jgi:hypothetical protein